MRHPVSYDDWLAHLDGQTGAERTAIIERHLEVCGECRETWRDLLRATSALRQAAEMRRAELNAPASRIERSRARVLERIRSIDDRLEAVAGGELTIARLRRLQSLVAPTCGARTAFQLIVAAVARTPVEEDTGAAWTDFLDQLGNLTSALCGRSVARLVSSIGGTLQ